MQTAADVAAGFVEPDAGTGRSVVEMLRPVAKALDLAASAGTEFDLLAGYAGG